MTPPQRFGRYELLEHIASGGMAEIFLARATGEAGFQRRLVVKRIRSELADDPRFVNMFINEARIGVHLNHPNVVQVYELGKVGGSYYIAMEHLPGKDLTRLRKVLRAQEVPLPHDVAVAIVAEACRGLAYAHTRTDDEGKPLGIVHQDVSPHNLIVTVAGEVKLVDFGIARLLTSARPAKEGTAHRPGGGKYAYMSPEQASGDALDHRSDLFSVGIVLWELIVGQRLFKHPDPAEKLRRVREAEVPHPSTFGVDIDPALWTVLDKALSRDPDDRYASADLLEEDLRAWLFESRSRVDRARIAALVRTAFPQLAKATTDRPLARLAQDLGRLAGEHTGTPSDDSARSRSPRAAERKPVVVVMVDVDGLTELSDRLEPEDMLRVNFRLLRWIRRVVDRHHGEVARAVDDHVTLLFGAQRTRFDDVERALACARALIRGTGALARSGGPTVQLAIGVHTGDVTVRPSPRRVRYVARGDTTRLARRLSAIADHGEVLITDALARRASARYRLRRGPPLKGRGGRPALDTYRVDGRRRGALPGDQGAWLPRGDELDTLRRALVELSQGTGGALTLCGEVGIGKSRLVREIRELANRRQIPCFVAHCDGMASERPLEPFRELVLDMLGLEPTSAAGAAIARAKAVSGLGLADRDLEAVATLLGASSRNPAGPLEIRDALQRLLLDLARGGPFIVALDDVHHLPRTDRTLLDSLLAGVRSAPILFLLTWDGATPHRLPGAAVPLAPLAEASQRRLIQQLLEAESVCQRLADLIARTCEGNPLYVEEMVTFLAGRGAIELDDGRATLTHADDAALPPSLAALIAARIDALDPGAKGALQLAAVIGARFDDTVLARAAGLDDAGMLCLELEAHGLILRGDGRGQWAFASHLVHQAALRGTLGVQRRDYHRMVALAIEARFADDLSPWREDLLMHCALGGRPIDAARYAYAAGEELEREQFLERARDVYRRGISVLQRATNDPDTYDARIQGEAMLTCRVGVVANMLGDTTEGDRALGLALDIASDAGIPWVELRAHLELGKSHAQRGATTLAAAHLDQARAMLCLEPDPLVEVEVLETQAELAFETARNAEAEALWNQALERAAGDPAAVARCQLGLANRFIRSGDHDRAEPLLDAALGAATRAGDRILEGRVLNNIGLLHSYAGRSDRALRYYRRALSVREGIGYTRGVVINHHNIGDTHFHAGQWPRAWVAFSRSRELAEEMGWQRGVALNDVYLAYLSAARREGSVDEILAAAERALALGDGEIASSGAWLAGRFLLEQGETAAARTQLARALDLAREWELTPMIRELEGLLAGAVSPAG